MSNRCNGCDSPIRKDANLCRGCYRAANNRRDAQIAEMVSSGITQKSVAAKMGLSKARVCQIVAARRPDLRPHPDDTPRARELKQRIAALRARKAA